VRKVRSDEGVARSGSGRRVFRNRRPPAGVSWHGLRAAIRDRHRGMVGWDSWCEFDEFERSDDLRHVEIQGTVDELNRALFIGIGEVFTVPREENIAAMEGGEGELMGITNAL